jgi:8-oxo-dGTP pyrophosphatase MutT (NUDIX family)
MSAIDDRLARTWDGLPISSEAPYGAMIVVYRRRERQREYLLLHNGHDGPQEAGDWVWGPPSGARWPGEPIDACAARELCEETGLQLALRPPSAVGAAAWLVYTAEAPADAAITLSEEHDRFAWLVFAEAAARIAPIEVLAGFLQAISTLPGDPRVETWG